MKYDYVCKNCGAESEADQRISDRPLKKCGECGKMALVRVITGGAGFILKGQNWEAKEGY